MDAYGAASAIDSKIETAWVVDPESEQKGEWIEIDLPKSKVDKISVRVGWEASEEKWKDHGRILKARIEVFTETDEGYKRLLEKNVTFEDKQGEQTIELDDTEVGDEIYGGRVRLTVTEVTPGEDYPSLAVSEVLVRLAEMDAGLTFPSGEPASAEKHDAMMMIDDNARTYWVSSGEGLPELTLEASGWGISQLGVQAGPKTFGRPKVIEVHCANQVHAHNLEDKTGLQWVPLPSVIGYTGSAWGAIKVIIKESYPGSQPGVGVTEMKIKATNYDAM
ncbi:MAG: hypothetical protein ACI9MC_001987 [Kiritimatiellia bacterium]|jgi:hypothetical protein